MIEIISIVTNIFTCLGIIIALFEFYLFRKSTYADYERNRKQSTIEMYTSVAEKLYSFNSFIYSKFNRSIIVYDEVKDDDEINKKIKTYLNEMEWIATGINTYVFDIDIFDRLFGDVAIRLSKQLRNYIEARRQIQNEPAIFIEHDKLIQQLEQMHENNVDGTNLNTKANIKWRL